MGLAELDDAAAGGGTEPGIVAGPEAATPTDTRTGGYGGSIPTDAETAGGAGAGPGVLQRLNDAYLAASKKSRSR